MLRRPKTHEKCFSRFREKLRAMCTERSGDHGSEPQELRQRGIPRLGGWLAPRFEHGTGPREGRKERARQRPTLLLPGARTAERRAWSEGDGEIAFDKRWSSCNLFVHLSIRNRGPDETYVSTQCSATQKEAWFSRPDANPFWSCGSKASACQRPTANLSLEAGSTPRFVVGPLSGASSAPDGAVVVTGWSLSLHRVLPGCRE